MTLTSFSFFAVLSWIFMLRFVSLETPVFLTLARCTCPLGRIYLTLILFHESCEIIRTPVVQCNTLTLKTINIKFNNDHLNKLDIPASASELSFLCDLIYYIYVILTMYWLLVFFPEEFQVRVWCFFIEHTAVFLTVPACPLHFFGFSLINLYIVIKP